MISNLRLGKAVGYAADRAAALRGHDGVSLCGKTVLFSNSPYAKQDAGILHGFALVEPDGAWSIGSASRIELRLRGVSADESHVACLELLPFEHAGHCASVVVSGDSGINRISVEAGRGWVQQLIPCRLDFQSNPPRAWIDINVANPRTPASLGLGEDTRALGIKIRSIRVDASKIDHVRPLATPAEGMEVAVPAMHGTTMVSDGSGGLRSRIVRLVHLTPAGRIIRWMRRVTASLSKLDQIQVEIGSMSKMASGLEAIASEARDQAARTRDELVEERQAAQTWRHAAAEALLVANEKLARNRIESNEALEAIDGRLSAAYASLEAKFREWSDLGMSAEDGLRRLSELQVTVESSHASLDSTLRKINRSVDAGAGTQSEIAGTGARMEIALNVIAGQLQQAKEEKKSQMQDANRMRESIASASEGVARIELLAAAVHSKLDASAIATTETVQPALAALNAKFDLAARLGDPQLAAVGELRTLLGAVHSKLDDLASRPQRSLYLQTSEGWIIETSFGYFSCAGNDDLLALCLIDTGDVERGLRLLLQRLLRPDDVFIDVGANIGLHTIAAARVLSATGRVHAVEAIPETLSHLRRSLRLSGVEDKVSVYGLAVGANAESGRQMYVSAISGHSSLFGLEGALGTVLVDVAPLDALIDGRADVVKIDVEGAELDVIRGMPFLLAGNPDMALVVEFAGSHLQRAGTELADWQIVLDGLGVSIFAIDDMTGECVLVENLGTLLERNSVNLLLAREGSHAWEIANAR